MPTPRAQRTPQPGSSLPSGKSLEDMFKDFAGMPPPPGVLDQPRSPEEILKLLKEGKIREVWSGRYGPVSKPEFDLQNLEQAQVQSHPKMSGFTSQAPLPNEPIEAWRKESARMFPTPTPTPTVRHQPPPYWYLPIQLRLMLDSLMTDKQMDKYGGFIIAPYHPIRAGGQK